MNLMFYLDEWVNLELEAEKTGEGGNVSKHNLPILLPSRIVAGPGRETGPRSRPECQHVNHANEFRAIHCVYEKL